MHEDIITFPYDGKNRPFFVSMCGVSYCDGTYRIWREHSDIWCVEYVMSGEGTIHLDDLSFSASAGDIYILPAGKKHLYYSDAIHPWKKIWFNISGDLVDKLMDCYHLRHIHLLSGLSAYPLFREFLDTAEKAENADTAHRLCAQCFLKIVQAVSEFLDSSQSRNQHSRAEQLKIKLDSVTDFNVSFDELLADMYCTKSHLIRVFKERYGITPYSYLLQKKLLVAKMMLKNTAMSIAEMSDFLGFRDCHYFSNFFKKNTGISPLQYRKQKMSEKY